VFDVLSLPAKSIRNNLLFLTEWSWVLVYVINIWNTEWDLEDVSFIFVNSVTLFWFPIEYNSNNSSSVLIYIVVTSLISTPFLLSS
jgi:hypothetical protein